MVSEKNNKAPKFDSGEEKSVYYDLLTYRSSLRLSNGQWKLLWAEIERLIEIHFILKASYKHEESSLNSTRKSLEKLERHLNGVSKQLEDLSENQFRIIQQHIFLKQGSKSQFSGSETALTLIQFTELINDVRIGVTGYKEHLFESLPKKQGKQKDHSASKLIYELSEFIRSNDIPITVTDSDNGVFSRLITSIFEHQLQIKLYDSTKRISNALTFFEGPKK
jgi:hypothetical protein